MIQKMIYYFNQHWELFKYFSKTLTKNPFLYGYAVQKVFMLCMVLLLLLYFVNFHKAKFTLYMKNIFLLI